LLVGWRSPGPGHGRLIAGTLIVWVLAVAAADGAGCAATHSCSLTAWALWSPKATCLPRQDPAAQEERRW